MNTMKRTPVHIVTGFLGSGKTTFLNYFISQSLPERILVIENECGDTNVDGALVMDGVEEVIELSAGCLCCSLADGLLDILEAAGNRRDEYDRMVIETTGIADPGSIIQVFLEDPRVENSFDLQQVICLADAGLVEEWLSETEEALRQIALADVLLINKADTVVPTYLEKVKGILDGINPQAAVLTGQLGVFSMHEILKTGTTNPIAAERTEENYNHTHEHKVGENSHNITTFTLTFPHPLDLNRLTLDLNRIVQLYRHQVYRVKGFIAIPNYPNRVLLQSACTAFIATDGSPWEEGATKEGKLVFIGRGLKRAVFEKMFNRHAVASDLAS